MQPIKSEMNINIFISGVQADQELHKILEEYPDSLAFSGKITIWPNQEGKNNGRVYDQTLPVNLYCCYAKEDEIDWNTLRTHLVGLQRGQNFAIQDNHSFLGGENPPCESLKRFDAANILLLLISNFFLANEQYWNLMRKAMTRSEEGTLRVVPVRLKPVAYNKSIPVYDLQWLPRDDQPINGRSNPDEAHAHVAEEVSKVIEVLLQGENDAQESE